MDNIDRRKLRKLVKRQERNLASHIGGRPTPSSGSGAVKGDAQTRKNRINETLILAEAKLTTKKSISLKLEWLTKVLGYAQQDGRYPLLEIEFVELSGKSHGKFYVAPEYLMNELLFGGRTY